jgi:hypothetical protein
MKSDIRGILDRGRYHRQDIVAAYRNSWPKNRPVLALALLGTPQSM